MKLANIAATVIEFCAKYEGWVMLGIALAPGFVLGAVVL